MLTKVAAVYLLVPEVGELFGGSLREERYDIIKADDLQLTVNIFCQTLRAMPIG
jgi:aspartyl/asparaginyl-tRNA synthetase